MYRKWLYHDKFAYPVTPTPKIRASILMIGLLVFAIGSYVLYSVGEVTMTSTPDKNMWERAVDFGEKIKQSEVASRFDVEYFEDFIEIEGTRTFYIMAFSWRYKQPPCEFIVLLLRQTNQGAMGWKALGTLHFLAKHGYFPIAVDLPGHGRTKIDRFAGKKFEFLAKFLRALPCEAKETAILMTSSSAEYALPYLAKYRADVKGVIAVSPGSEYGPDYFKPIDIPMLLFYGTGDEGAGEIVTMVTDNVEDCKVVPIINGGHDAHLDDLILFHNEIITFLDSL